MWHECCPKVCKSTLRWQRKEANLREPAGVREIERKKRIVRDVIDRFFTMINDEAQEATHWHGPICYNDDKRNISCCRVRGEEKENTILRSIIVIRLSNQMRIIRCLGIPCKKVQRKSEAAEMYREGRKVTKTPHFALFEGKVTRRLTSERRVAMDSDDGDEIVKKKFLPPPCFVCNKGNCGCRCVGE